MFGWFLLLSNCLLLVVPRLLFCLFLLRGRGLYVQIFVSCLDIAFGNLNVFSNRLLAYLPYRCTAAARSYSTTKEERFIIERGYMAIMRFNKYYDRTFSTFYPAVLSLGLSICLKWAFGLTIHNSQTFFRNIALLP